ncbi:alginate lyase family protein [Nocardioides koreensis]|uniref:Alginate lyase family protein n=1 Tax=Nocardioides koreensis TaxID=433651 RepID=A0ABN2ZJ55_9ACTN
MSRQLGWYAQRLRQMSATEVAGRVVDEARRATWARRQVLPGAASGLPGGLRDCRVFPTPLPAGTREEVPAEARRTVVAAADRLVAGHWSLLGTPREDIVRPDWFRDPVTGRRAPQDRLAFRINHRDEQETGNVKAVWELSRHHHLTVLATAWWLTSDDAYALLVDEQLRSWWAENPFLSGVHWTSGIELGVRLTSWVWVRRLLDDWSKVEDLFDTNEDALRQIWWHQHYLSAFRSRGSSANNHVVAEEAGRLAAACAFPWYAESDAWREDASRRLQRELRANTFDSGVNRELATDYHRFVTELGLVAAVESEAVGHPLLVDTWALLAASLDAAAAMVDETGRPPRQGDGDEGRALVLDDPDAEPWGSLLGLGAALVDPRPWWPTTAASVGAVTTAALVPHRPVGMRRPETAPRAFPDAGMYLLRTPAGDGPEIWCRCDGGPHGFLSIAAHAHADALSVEVRHGGVDVLVDPGTYCYHGEPAWRSYFRSTLAHNTIEVDGTSQSVETGPFLWSTHTDGHVTGADIGEHPVQTWTAHHTGYARLDPTLRHTRTVTLDGSTRSLAILDEVTGEASHGLRLAFHVGPEVDVRLVGAAAELSWPSERGTCAAVLHLPEQLRWTAHRGEAHPVLGWYSPRFGERIPTTTLIGSGVLEESVELRSTLDFGPEPRTTTEEAVTHG